MADPTPDRLTQSPQWIFEHIRSYVDEQLRLQQAEIDRRVTTVRREIETTRILTDRIFNERDRTIADAGKHRAQAIEVMRISLEQKIEDVRREMNLINDASERAITKSETATEHRLESINEWRQQSIDRERGIAEERAKLQTTLLPRETFETWKNVVENQLSESEGEKRGVNDFRANVLSVLAVLVAFGTLVVLVAGHL